ncbi:hypothetical protein RJ639_017716 [Escallonia herrerae]|uniref:protein-tyrosine-phosphatase n=1 Tax=Escallonia herrerae TaxID=1293975 RepID=A0AA88VDN0_9ASTE|nr:hypothetical protein RJ639_017716 [Escallonia herrerae]
MTSTAIDPTYLGAKGTRISRRERVVVAIWPVYGCRFGSDMGAAWVLLGAHQNVLSHFDSFNFLLCQAQGFTPFFACVRCSAAIITAYLMRTEQLSHEGLNLLIYIFMALSNELEMYEQLSSLCYVFAFDSADALESLRKSCESVCPNDGFLDQLKMFEEMGFKVDHASSIYKRFHLKVLGDSYNRGERIDCSKFGADPGLPSEEASQEIGASLNKAAISTPAYRCKKCRRVVALQDNVVNHVPGEGESAFGWHKRSSNRFNRNDEVECSSIFVEPLCWMRTVEEGALEGKLSCVHCDARLGYFNWSGIQCSCGSWITPAFQLHKSRVDISTV